MFAPIRLKDQQAVIARAFGNGHTLDIVQSRGAGKTWLIAMCSAAMCVLYPGTIVMCCSGTGQQATLVLQKLENEIRTNINLSNEMAFGTGRKAIQYNKTGGRCVFKNGSQIRAMPIGSMRGQRAKILIIDESPEVKLKEDSKIFMPVRNYTRDVCITYGIKDYPSKVVKITSACLKSNDFYDDFVAVSKTMATGDRNYFSIILDKDFAIRTGITDAEFFEQERSNLPEAQYQMEYESVFIGAESNSVFPYELTDACRTLERVETRQPKNSKSQYVLSFDIAMSVEATADNSVISILKISERDDGTYMRQLVYMRSFKGVGIDEQAGEIRRLLAKFPNIVRIVFDQNGLGESFPKLMNKPWVDPETGREHPPLVMDDEISYIPNAQPLLRGFRGSTDNNQRLATDMRFALEKGLIEFPINSRRALDGTMGSGEDSGEDDKAPMGIEEQAIYIEADALQVEMGNIVASITSTGKYSYGTARASQKKDRYSSVSMGNSYVTELETRSVRRKYEKSRDVVVGIASHF